MKGSTGCTGQSPSAACRSVWQTPLVRTLSRTSPGPGCGTGMSSMTRGRPNARTTAAFMRGLRYGDESAMVVRARGHGLDGDQVVPEFAHVNDARNRWRSVHTKATTTGCCWARDAQGAHAQHGARARQTDAPVNDGQE